MKISGGKQNEVTIEPTAGCPVIGPTLAIALSEAPGSRVEWDLIVDVDLEDGRRRLGRVRTVPPSWLEGGDVAAAFPGLAWPDRVVAVAWCPGARKWHVRASIADITGPAPPAPDSVTAQMVLATADTLPGMNEPGVTPVHPQSMPGRFVRGIRTLQANVGVAAALFFAQNPNRLRGLIHNDGAAPVWIGQDGTLTAASGFKLDPGQTFSFTHTREVWLIALVAAELVSLLEDVG